MKNGLLKIAKPIVERFPKIASAYRYARDQNNIREIPRETSLGFKLVGNESMRLGEFEQEETEIVKKVIPHVDIVINVGANIGYYCCIALHYGKRVVAFEPIYLNLCYLLRNIKINNWEAEIEVFPLALSNKIGVIEIYGGGTGASLLEGWAGTPKDDVTLVPTSTLDNVLGDKFSGKRCFFIVDIEGAEKFMLEGAIHMLEMKPKPIWMMEISISEHQPEGVKINPNLLSTFRFFWDRDYEARTANQEYRVVHPEEIERISQGGEDTFDVHNFIFVEKEMGEILFGNEN